MRRLLFAGLAVLSAFTLFTGPAFAAKDTATDTFVGTATTGAGQVFPVDVVGYCPVAGPVGTVGLAYLYKAVGEAKGKLKGDFVYEEHGCLFFAGDPSNPMNFAGSAFLSGVFTLTTKKGETVTIADTSPSSYSHGVTAADISSLSHGAMKTLAQVFDKKSGALPKGGTLVYGYFTFTNNHGTFTGYATPDFRKFAIEITFDV